MPLVWTSLSMAGAILACFFVLSPLRGRRPQRATTSGETLTPSARKLNELLEQRDAALSGLAELDFDRSLGNLSEADYQEMRAQYRTQAIGILKELDKQAAQGAAVSGSGLPDAHQALLPVRASIRHEAGAPTQISRRALGLIGGAIAVVLLAITLGTMALRGAGAPSAEDAPMLDVLHAHVALLVSGTDVALIGHHGGLLRSADGGASTLRSWQSVPGVTGDVVALTTATTAATTQGSPVFLATADSVMKSSDAGLTWELLPLPRSGAQISMLAIGEGLNAKERPLSLYASVVGVGLFRTDDLREWRLVGSGLPADATSMVWRQGPFSALYAAGPRDGVLAAGDDGHESIGGWGSANGVLSGVLPTLAVRSLAVDPMSGDRFTMTDGTELAGAMYAATDLGIYKTIDAGSSWSTMPLRVPLVAVSARSLPSPLMLAVDSRGRVWRSADRGGTWSAKP